MTPESDPLTLLIAAHEPSQAAALSELIHFIRPDFRLSFTSDEGAADLALVVEMPGEHFGQQLEMVRERHPNAAIVMISPAFDEPVIAMAARWKVAALVPSPCEPLALAKVIKAQERRVRFPGRCGSIRTAELLRLHAVATSSGVLHLSDTERTGAIHLEDGQPVHAQAGGLVGAEAVREMLSWIDVDATWMDGRSGSARTIVGRIEGLLERDLGQMPSGADVVEDAPREMLERLDHLAGIEDILGVYLLRNTEVTFGRNDASLDEVLISRALTGLARVFLDMEDQQGDRAGSEIQAMVGDHRLVVDRVGPARLGFQIGVVVRQATPVCKSLRRLLRQIDRNFRRTLNERARQGVGSSASSGQSSGQSGQSSGQSSGPMSAAADGDCRAAS